MEGRDASVYRNPLCRSSDGQQAQHQQRKNEFRPALPPLDLVESERYLSRTAGAQYVMSNSFAFGGSNVSLILGR